MLLLVLVLLVVEVMISESSSKPAAAEADGLSSEEVIIPFELVRFAAVNAVVVGVDTSLRYNLIINTSDDRTKRTTRSKRPVLLVRIRKYGAQYANIKDVELIKSKNLLPLNGDEIEGKGKEDKKFGNKLQLFLLKKVLKRRVNRERRGCPLFI